MEEKDLEKFIDSNYIYAIVGATINQEKYGYKILVDLKNKGYNVIPINPKYDEVAGLKCYPDLMSIDDRPDVVVLVVGEKNAERVVQDCVDSDLDKIWFQPGSEYEDAVRLAQEAKFDIVTNECIMVETGKMK